MLSYRKLAMCVLGRPFHTGGGIDSPRPASQRAAAFILTAALLTTLTAPAFAGTWDIGKGDIIVKAGDTEGTNKVSQGEKKDVEDTDTIITGKSDKNTVTIEAKDKNDKVEVTLDNVNIKTDSGSALTSEGDVTLTLKGDNSLTGGISDNGSYGRYGINSNGSLTITGGETDRLTAQGGSGTYDGGSGIYSNGSLTLSGGTVNANGGNSGGRSDGGYGIHSGSLTISGSTVNATGGNGSNDRSSSGGSGIHIFGNGSLTVSDGTVTATGGNGGTGNASDGGSGISSSGSLTISGSTLTATGGNGGTGDHSNGGSGISSSGSLTIKGGTVKATGGDSGNGNYSDGGSGIDSSSGVTISGGTVDAKGGNSGNGNYSAGGNGIDNGGRSGSITISGGTVDAKGGNSGTGDYSSGGSGICNGGSGIDSGNITISGGTVNATGGNDGNGNYGYGGSGIHSVSGSIDLSGSLELTAKAGSSNGKALSQNGSELDLDTIKDKLDPGAKVTATDANGETKQVSIPRPVEPEGPVIPEESSSSSGGGSAAPSAPASSLPGLVVTDKDGQRISYTSTQSGNTLTVCVGRFTVSFRISLAALRQLRAKGIETIAFQTVLCSTTLSLDELLAMGGEDAEAVLTHRLTDSSLTVG